MCSPNEDLRPMFLSCSGQMWREKNCTKWYLARENPHPAPMWTQHQRPTHKHVRPIYNPARGAPSDKTVTGGSYDTHTGQRNCDNSRRLAEATLCQMVQKCSNIVQSGSSVLTQPINKWKQIQGQLLYSTNTHLCVCLTALTSPSAFISTLKS